MKNFKLIPWISLVIFVSLAGVIFAKEKKKDDNPYVWKPRTTSVSVFKNGLGFFMREGDTVLRDGWCVAGQVPPAAFGTLAIYSHDEDEIVDIVGSGPGEKVEFNDEDFSSDLKIKKAKLEENLNLNVQIKYDHTGKEKEASGKILSVGPKFVILENDSNNFAVKIVEITSMKMLDYPIRVHVSKESKSEAKKTRLGMAYLRKGITWIPEYTMKVIDEETAELTLRGTLINEAEDLVHCDVNFVVGVPHFIHSHLMAPIAAGQVIRAISASVAPSSVMSQSINSAAMFYNNAPLVSGNIPDISGSANLDKLYGNLPQMGGAAGTDYTVYKKSDLTLRRGEKAIVTLFRKKIKYSHLYRWDIPCKMKHFLVLHNITDTAWTTGACLAISSGQPLSEDILKYTPKNGTCEIPVTTAINIAHVRKESELDRKLKDHSPAKNIYLDLVTLKGELKLHNYEKSQVEIIINTPVQGKPVSTTDEGNTSIDTGRLN
jgi:hypothetical protein